MEKRQKINRAEQYSLLLLAGGKSSRMGRDKAELSLDGKSFLSCQVTKAEQLAIREIFLSGHGTGKLIKERTESENRVHIHEISDIYKDRGPLGGIHACMKSMETPYCLVLSVDVPQIPERVLEELLTIHERKKSLAFSSDAGSSRASKNSDRPLLLIHNSRKEPLIAIYPVSMAKEIEEIIKLGSASVFQFLDKTGYDLCAISVEEWQVQNINTPKDYIELQKYMEKRNEK